MFEKKVYLTINQGLTDNLKKEIERLKKSVNFCEFNPTIEWDYADPKGNYIQFITVYFKDICGKLEEFEIVRNFSDEITLSATFKTLDTEKGNLITEENFDDYKFVMRSLRSDNDIICIVNWDLVKKDESIIENQAEVTSS